MSRLLCDLMCFLLSTVLPCCCDVDVLEARLLWLVWLCPDVLCCVDPALVRTATHMNNELEHTFSCSIPGQHDKLQEKLYQQRQT